MSLFPAYSATSSAENDAAASTGESASTDWLRFSSFKPTAEKDDDVILVEEEEPDKQRAKTTDDDIEIVHERKKSPSPTKSSSHKRRHKRKESGKRKRRRRHSSSSSPSDTNRASAPVVIAPKWSLLKSKPASIASKDDPLFILDNRREIENFQYGTIYKYHLAKFSTYVHRCFGNASQRIDRLFFGDRVNRGEKTRRYYSKKLRQAVEDVKVMIPKRSTTGEQSFQEPLPEYLPLDNKMVIDGAEYVYDPKLQMFRRLDADETSASDDVLKQDDAPLTDSSLMMENRRVNRLVTDNPHDVGLWREFLRLQDRLFRDHRPSDPNRGGIATGTALLERKLSVLDKAIEKNPTNVELKLLRLHIARDLGWDTNRLRDEWRRLEFLHVNDPSMWIGRLQFERGGTFSGFSISRQSAAYDLCLERFSAVLSGQLASHPPPANGESYLVDFLLAKIRFLLDCGHTEQAIASIQALMEFNFKRRSALDNLPLKDKRQFFEPFWDSNQPRVGDEGALGWAETMKNKPRPVETPSESSEEEDELCKRRASLRDAGLWLELERLRESKHWLPWRSADEPDDPQRIVLFDDIAGILYDVADPGNRFYLFLELLSSCGMKLPSLFSTNKTIWYDENVLLRALDIFDCLPRFRRPSLSGNDQLIQRLCSEADVFFPGSSTHKLFLAYGQFEHAAISLASDDVSSKEKLKRYKKTAKSILDDDRWRDQLALYVAYSRGLMALGAFDEASTVAQTALNTARLEFRPVDGSIETAAILNLIHIWIECLFEDKSKASMEVIIEKLGGWLLSNVWSTERGPASFSKTTALKARSILLERLTQWKSNGFSNGDEEKFLVSWLGSIGTLLSHIIAIYNYVTTDNLDSSRQFYDEMREFLKTFAMDRNDQASVELWEKDLERLWNLELKLLDYHLRSNSSAPPRLLVRCLENALIDFPSNAHVLKLYADMHLSGQLMVKLRRFFDHRRESPTSRGDSANIEVSWIAAIYSEFARFVKVKEQQSDDLFGGGLVPETNRLRNVLAKAVDACSNCVLLWRLRLTLESYLGERESVKRTFYLAIRQCPWAKDLYMDAIALLPDEGQSIVDLMIEKGLRVRVPWEELQLLRKAADRE